MQTEINQIKTVIDASARARVNSSRKTRFRVTRIVILPVAVLGLSPVRSFPPEARVLKPRWFGSRAPIPREVRRISSRELRRRFRAIGAHRRKELFHATNAKIIIIKPLLRRLTSKLPYIFS